MKIRLILTFCLGVMLALGACFDSLINDTCASGYRWSGGSCVVQLADSGMPDSGPPDSGPPDSGAPDAGPLSDAGALDGPLSDAGVLDGPGSGSDATDARTDASVDAAVDAAPDAPADAAVDAVVDAAPDAPADASVDALVCEAPTVDCRGLCVDTASDPDNCGACSRVCASGVCTSGVCAGDLRGHVVAIGHDYQSHHSAMARVLGNAIALGVHFNLGIARLRGTASTASANGTSAAISTSLSSLGRPWHSVTLPGNPAPSALTGVDTLVIDAQLGDGDAAQALGASWRADIARFLLRGGVVVVLEGNAGVSYRFAIGADLFTVDAPVDATGQLALIVAGTDATTQQVPSPYLAETTSVTMPGLQAPAISAFNGGTIVFHTTR